MRKRSLEIMAWAKSILEQHRPMTVRQVFYQLVAKQIIKNSRSQYQAVSNILVQARKAEIIPWDWIEDRLRRPRHVSMWSDLTDFGDTVMGAYRRDVWVNQPTYIEVWVEKDALSGILEDAIRDYGVTLNVGRGYDGWDSIHNAATRFKEKEVPTVILYFGDFDPSGEDMVRSLCERLGFFGCEPELIKCALTEKDIETYNLPPDLTKKKDSRQKAFVEKYGDVSVELDALPVDVLRDRIVEQVESRMNLDELAKVKRKEKRDKNKLVKMLAK